jgi:selenide,water dikinase
MGGEPYSVMNIVCFPSSTMAMSVLKEILAGGLLKIQEAGAMLVGGHSVQDKELKYGLSVSGVVDADCYATNAGLRPGDVLVLTKPIGSGVLATAIKAEWEGAGDDENELYLWASRLNRYPGEAIARYGLTAATDVTGFGLGGHLLEMAMASGVAVRLDVGSVPLMGRALELARMGLLPAGSYANKHYCDKTVMTDSGLDTVMIDLMFDAQTSGGLVLAVSEGKAGELCAWLSDHGEMAAVIGTVEQIGSDGKRLLLC